MNRELLYFEKFRKTIRDKIDKLHQEFDDSDNFNINDEIKKSSHNHHYIPQYYIKGFTDSKNLLFVYDKKRDRINNGQKGSAGVFFQKDRNSMKVNDSFVSIFEDAYSFTDNILTPTIKLLRSNITDVSNEILVELMAYLNIFVVDIFWRNINNDVFFDELYARSKVDILGINVADTQTYSKSIKEMEGFKQLIRGQFLGNYMKLFQKSDPNIVNTGELIDFPMEQICIGDNPLLFKTRPKSPCDLFYNPLIIPISRSKFYKRNIERKTSYDLVDTTVLNAVIIDQSSHLVCSSSLKTLEDAIKTYKYLKENNCTDQFKNSLFE